MRRRPAATALFLGAIAIVIYACATPLTPEDVRLVPLRVDPVGTTQVNGQAGQPVSGTMTVRVVAKEDEPLGGIRVNFTANSGSVSPAEGVTGEDGTVTVGTWTLPETAGSATLRAEVAGFSNVSSATFTATVSPGPPTQLAKQAGDDQTAIRGSTLPINPTVVVEDQFGNPVSGVQVSFVPRSTNGTASPTEIASGTDGTAATAWTLGNVVGEQRLTASLNIDHNIKAVFVASSGRDPCDPVPYGLANRDDGALAAGDCQQDSKSVDFYRFSTTAATTYVRVGIGGKSGATLAFDPWLRSYLWGNSPNGANWTWFQTSGQQVFADLIVPAGSFDFAVTSSAAGATGDYEITSSVDPAPPSGCVDFLVTKGISVNHELDANCNYTPTTQPAGQAASKEYIIYVPANSTTRVIMQAGTIVDPYLECFDVTTSTTTFITGCSNDDDPAGGTLDAVLDIPTATTDRFVLIKATHATNNGTTGPLAGTYSLTINP